MNDYSDAQLRQFGQQLKQLMAQQDAGTLPWDTAPPSPKLTKPCHPRMAQSKERHEITKTIGDYYPGYDDRKDLSEIWQDHAPLPDAGSSEIHRALIAVAQYGYKQRMDEEV